MFLHLSVVRRRATITNGTENRRTSRHPQDRRSVQIFSSQSNNPNMRYAPQISQHGKLERNITVIQRSNRNNKLNQMKQGSIKNLEIDNSNNQEIPTSPPSPVSPRYSPKPSTIVNRKIKRSSKTFSAEEKELLKNNNPFISTMEVSSSTSIINNDQIPTEK